MPCCSVACWPCAYRPPGCSWSAQAFAVVYIAEAHARDEWPVGLPFSSHNAPTSAAERVAAARRFAEAWQLSPSIPVMVDPLSNAFEGAYAAWPVRAPARDRADVPRGCRWPEGDLRRSGCHAWCRTTACAARPLGRPMRWFVLQRDGSAAPPTVAFVAQPDAALGYQYCLEALAKFLAKPQLLGEPRPEVPSASAVCGVASDSGGGANDSGSS